MTGLLLKKEMRLGASPLSYYFLAFGFMALLPGYPVLCGVFFVTLGIFQSYLSAREANDAVFSALLPVAKSDVVKGKFIFAVFIELCAFLLMAALTAVRMTALWDSAVYRANALMTANPFFLGTALLIFGLFNLIFISGFFKTAYNITKPFITYIIAAFAVIAAAEASHCFPGLGWLNAFGFDYIGRQMLTLAAGLVLYILLTLLAYRKSCRSFELIDL